MWSTVARRRIGALALAVTAGAAGAARAAGASGGAPAPSLEVRAVRATSAVLGSRVQGAGRTTEIERRRGAGEWKTVAALAPGADAHTDSGLEPGTRYSYRARLVATVTTEIIRGGEEARRLSVAVPGAREIVLTTGVAGDGYGYDHAIWGSPALVRPDGTRRPLGELTPASAEVGWEKPKPPREYGIGTRSYAGSVYAHAPSRFVYELEPGYARFEADVGIDASQGRRGTVTFAVSAPVGGCSKEVAVTTRDLFRSPGRRRYHLDAERGDDEARGTSPRSAWRTIDRVNSSDLAPGDSVLLRAGQTFAGTLRLTEEDGGTERRPVTVSSYGDGRATTDGGAGDGVVLDGCEHVRVENLKVVGCGRKKGSDGSGVRIRRTRRVSVDALEVTGFRGSGVDAGGDEDTRITNVRAHANGFAGIAVHGGWGDLPRTRNIYIARCVAENNAGDPRNLTNHSGNGIVVGGLDVGFVEYCEAFNNGWDMPRKGNGPVGIWGWNCDRLVIQHCVSHDNKTAKGAYDGGGFDFDGGVTNSALQYNLSYNNHGAGYLLCQFPGASRWKDNVCRYNISVNDGLTGHFSGIHFWAGGEGISDALVYNNTIVNARNAINSTHDVAGLVFRNNVLVAGGDVVSGHFSKSVFEGNLYRPTGGGAVYRSGGAAYATVEEWAKAMKKELLAGKIVGVRADPGLRMPPSLTDLPTNPDDLAGLRYYAPLAGSPCIGAGVLVEDNGGRDLRGAEVPAAGAPGIGAISSARGP